MLPIGRAEEIIYLNIVFLFMGGKVVDLKKAYITTRFWTTRNLKIALRSYMINFSVSALDGRAKSILNYPLVEQQVSLAVQNGILVYFMNSEISK